MRRLTAIVAGLWLCGTLACDRPIEAVAGGEPPPESAVARRGCPAGMARVETPNVDVCVDLYEFPGFGLLPDSLPFEQARGACASRGVRLCTEREWEVACRGPRGDRYPYGDAFDPARCATDGVPKPAGTRNGCRSAFGTYDMSGNAAEWVDTAMLKGGDVGADAFGARCGTRARATESSAPTLTGFRCCLDPAD